MKISVSTPQEGHRYWAFLSYSRSEARQARSLHRRLERFGVPRPLRSSPAGSRLPEHRLRPIFRDEAEIAASGALDERLRDAIDESAAMVLLASSDSARSHYVDLEVAHFVATRGLRRLVIVAVGEGGHPRAPLPPALRNNETPGYCGSGGCGTEVYMTRAPGDYHQVLSLLGNSTPRVRASSTGPDQIISTDLTVSREPLYAVHSFVGDRYRRTSYEFCDGVLFEGCSPVVIAPVPRSDSLKVAPGTVLRERPDLASRPVTVGAKGTQNDFSPADAAVEGVLPDRQWYLVDQWKGSGGFVPASAVHR